MRYESTHASHVVYVFLWIPPLTSFPSSIWWFRILNMFIWRIIMSLALWIIWKARCDYIFNNVHIHLNSMHIDFWMLFVHTLRGQYDDMQGSDEVLWQRQVAFKNWCQGLHLFSDTTPGPKWNFMPYLLLCWLVDRTILLVSYMTSSVSSDVLRSEMKCLLFFLSKVFK